MAGGRRKAPWGASVGPRGDLEAAGLDINRDLTPHHPEHPKNSGEVIWKELRESQETPISMCGFLLFCIPHIVCPFGVSEVIQVCRSK